MKPLFIPSLLASLCSFSTSTILENGQVRKTNFLDTKIATIGTNATGWKTYGANATELSYKGRWDDKHISWWAAPGLKFGFSGQDVAITFGPHTSPGVLIAYRVAGLDWQMTNISASSTHHLVSPQTPGLNLTLPHQLPLTFELRVTNWAYGVQISSIHLTANATLIKIPPYPRKIELIGDSLTSGMYSTYETFSGFGYTIGAGLGSTEFSITAYPGICLHDAPCWGQPHGQTFQYWRISDNSPRALELYGSDPPMWDAENEGDADIVIVNLGTNDANKANNVSSTNYYSSYITFVQALHRVHPRAQIVLMSLWNGFSPDGNTWRQTGAWGDEIWRVYKVFEKEGFVHYFNSTGVLQKSDIGPQWHPTDVGHVKIASHVMQYIRMKFGWEFMATGPEVQHETLYWNDQSDY